MAIKLGKQSMGRMVGLDPRLARVVMRAAAMAEPVDDFMVLEGLRSEEQCYVNYGKGRTAAQLKAKGVPPKYAKPGEAKVTWLGNPLGSKHRTGKAVDVCPYPIDWNDLARFNRLAALLLRAASIEGVAIRWGADWDGDGRPREKGETDSPHFELVD